MNLTCLLALPLTLNLSQLLSLAVKNKKSKVVHNVSKLRIKPHPSATMKGLFVAAQTLILPSWVSWVCAELSFPDNELPGCTVG
jgi:hypothetical protein